jgi:hypothetical protein
VGEIAADVRSVDPAAYAAAIGLRPEDCYGFLPIDHDDVTPYLYLYRDRPEYEQARVGLADPQRVQKYGPIRVEPPQHLEINIEGVPGAAGGDLSELLAAAQQMAEASGGSGYGSYTGAPAAPVGAGRIIGHRLYPRTGRRSSTRQLNHFLPRYREALNLCSEDVYGVLPRSTRWSGSGSGGNTKEWDDFWIVYRDRPEYEQGREAWAREMHDGGGWPATIVSPGVGAPPGVSYDGARLKVEKDGWPRHKLVIRETGTELGESLRKKIDKWGYEPEDSLGFCPDFAHRSIYFAWRGG